MQFRKMEAKDEQNSDYQVITLQFGRYERMIGGLILHVEAADLGGSYSYENQI